MSRLRTAPRSLLGARAGGYDEHLSSLGPLPDIGAGTLIEMVTAAGLTGRGGAAFPTGRKLAAVATRRDAVVVGNGAEGEPASSKDRVLLNQAPHLVLDGLALAAQATGATSTFLYAPADILDRAVGPALRERRREQSVTLVASADSFISGQETAVVAAVQGQQALPTNAADPVFRRGVRGRPTLVQNVETLAQLALIARFGPDWFRGCGTDAEPGSRLVTVSGSVRSPAVIDIPGGSRLGDIVDWAGGPSEPLQAILVGGYHGGWVPWDEPAWHLPLTQTALQPYHAAPGAGVLLALPVRRCGLQASAEVVSYLAGQSAGQCGPCVRGLPTLAQQLGALASRRTSVAAVHELHRVTTMVDGRGACRHPDGTVRLVRSALSTFAAEVDRHLRGECTAEAYRRRA